MQSILSFPGSENASGGYCMSPACSSGATRQCCGLRGHIEAARKSYKQARILHPDFPEATCNLLHTLQVQYSYACSKCELWLLRFPAAGEARLRAYAAERGVHPKQIFLLMLPRKVNTYDKVL